ncbi:hypothetical protein [Candidatus Poriferisodalis sp.]|uniref:hypothetical protein n=1 Tax=Candidatus Poriferisodalis sp. TaxID=3101277 RepID=UPI003B5284A3
MEAQPLEGIVQEAEIAELAGLSATLPADVRDPAGRWRSVLDDWRNHGSDLPEEVSVEQALGLVGDEGRPVTSSIALVAVALEEGFGARLLELPCVIARDGQRLVPPAADSMTAVAAESAGLAEQLGIATPLHPAHFEPDNGAPEVIAWLKEYGALLDGSEDSEVVRRLAAAGRSGRCPESLLDDEQLCALRDAFECLPQETRRELGLDVGRAILLDSYTLDAEGKKKADTARPADAYLSRAIDREQDSFAIAAGKSRGLMWLADRYADSLRSPAGRDGIGAQRFLRLLGAETAPRLRPHPQLRQRFSAGGRRGLPKSLAAGPEARAAAMQEIGATYTLEDYDSPDLLAVITDISQERRGKLRRKRAGALLSALSRAWDRRLSDYAEVDAANDHYVWNLKGKIPVFWLAQAGDIAWLDDESGRARNPAELRVRTAGTAALYGENSSDFVHDELDQPIRRTVLAALGVSDDPSRSELVTRLRDLSGASQRDETASGDLRRESTLVYRALVVRL